MIYDSRYGAHRLINNSVSITPSTSVNTYLASSNVSGIAIGAASESNVVLTRDVSGICGFSLGLDAADGGKFKIQNRSGGASGSVGAPQFTLTTIGYVGIGTSSPSYPLTVSSGIAAGGTGIQVTYPSLTSNTNADINVGQSATNNNSANPRYPHKGNGSVSNYVGIGL